MPPAPQYPQAGAPGQPNSAPQTPPPARQPQTAGDPANAGSELEQLKGILLGMARTQNMLTLLVLELCQHHLGMDKPTLATLAVRNSQAGEPERLFEQAASQGKAG